MEQGEPSRRLFIWMRFRYLLPSVQIIVSFVFVLIPLWRYLPYYRPAGPDGNEIVCHDNCPYPNLYGVDAVAVSTAVNLPAAIVVLPVLSAKWNYAEDRHDYFHDPVWRSVGFTSAGLIVWFLAGRMLDDVTASRNTGAKRGFRLENLVFALIAATTATLAVVAWTNPRHLPSLWYVFWLPVWGVGGYSGITIEILWLVRTRKPNLRTHL